MGSFQKNDLLSIINKNAADLRMKIDMHCELLNSIIKQETAENGCKITFRKFTSPAEARLKKVIAEAVEELEKSRSAFKSRRLEALRKKLTHVLIETGEDE